MMHRSFLFKMNRSREWVVDSDMKVAAIAGQARS